MDGREGGRERERERRTLTQLRRNPIHQLEFLGVNNQHFRERSEFRLSVKNTFISPNKGTKERQDKSMTDRLTSTLKRFFHTPNTHTPTPPSPKAPPNNSKAAPPHTASSHLRLSPIPWRAQRHSQRRSRPSYTVPSCIRYIGAVVRVHK
jgi:hypothetical protein